MEQNKKLIEVLNKYENDQSMLVACLNDISGIYGYLPKDVIAMVCQKLNLSESHVYGVITFYSQFKLTPPAKINIDVCLGTACFVLGANVVLSTLEEHLKIKIGEVSKDNKYAINQSRCLGCCGLAPVITINGEVFGHVSKDNVLGILKKVEEKLL